MHLSRISPWPMKRTTFGELPPILLELGSFLGSIWDWQNKQRLSRFSVAGKGSSVSSMHFVNETAASLLLTASSKFPCEVIESS